MNPEKCNLFWRLMNHTRLPRTDLIQRFTPQLKLSEYFKQNEIWYTTICTTQRKPRDSECTVQTSIFLPGRTQRETADEGAEGQ